MKRWAVLLLPWMLAACDVPQVPWTAPPTEPLDLEISLSATKVRLLEPITVHLDLFRRDGLEVEWAPVVEGKDFRVETTKLPEVPFGDGHWQRTTLLLRAVRGPGELLLPSFVAKAKDGSVAASTPEQKVTVESALLGQAAELEAPGEPFPVPSQWPWYLAAGGAVLALGTLAFVALRRSRSHVHHPVAVAVPPHVKALRALERLRTAARTTPAQVEAFYVEVSGVLRTYLEERFGLHAPERTTEEFLRELEGGDRLAREHRAELERFLSRCDLVKFAAQVPGESDHLAMHALALAFVEATRSDRGAASTPQAVGA